MEIYKPDMEYPFIHLYLHLVTHRYVTQENTQTDSCDQRELGKGSIYFSF